MPAASALAGAGLSPDPISDLQQLTEYPFMVNALEAGTIVAVTAGAVGWFMVLRRQTFAGHTLSLMAFPGATFALLLANFFGMFAWWGLFTWLPPYLSLPPDQGGRGFGALGTTALLVVLNLFGMFPGYAGFGWVADRLGRRRSFVLYTGLAAILVPIYALARAPWLILVVGTATAFFGTGFFSGSGIIGSEIFPTHVRARALGFTYNGARTMSAVAPYVIGRVGQARGLSWAFYLASVAFFFSMLAATQLPETRGKALD